MRQNWRQKFIDTADFAYEPERVYRKNFKFEVRFKL
jgi:hypothetical protein